MLCYTQRVSFGCRGAAVRIALLRVMVCVFAVFAVIATPVRPAQSADLKMSLVELARILTATLNNPKVRLHNLPGGFLDITPGSSLGIGNQTVPLTVPVRTFDIAGGQYAFYVNELNSQSVTITAGPSVLRITVTFESEEPELLGRCLSGICAPNSSLPQIEWVAPSVTIDLTPVWVNGNLALDAKRVEVGGSFMPQCESGGFFTGSLCRLVLPQARKVTNNLKTDLAAELKTLINGAQTQAQIASSLRPYLKFGPVGEVRFSKITVDSQNLTLSFCLACQAQ